MNIPCSIVGVEILQQLRTLNLSHNFIKYIYGLEKSILLIELDLTMNHVEDLSYMPPLSNLQILHISNNRVTSHFVYAIIEIFSFS